ncbi:hypothetical protein FHG87_025004 [Trinorchestia longiramus]|nr:hypothetical protein FHG87_025004 [Trinorchestia longiramus]
MWGFIMRRRAFLIACFRLALLGWSLYTCYVVLPVRDVHASLPQEGSRDREDLLKVVEFTGTPSLAEYKGFLNSSRRMTSLTACVRFRVRTFTGRDPLLSLQDIATNRKIQLWLELWLDRVRLVLADTWRFQLLPRHLRPNV